MDAQRFRRARAVRARQPRRRHRARPADGRDRRGLGSGCRRAVRRRVVSLCRRHRRQRGAAPKRITIYRVPEPDGASGYGRGLGRVSRDISGRRPRCRGAARRRRGRLHIVTKGETGPVAIYRFPAQMQSGATVTLERVGAERLASADADSRITDGSVSPDGQWVVLRTRSALTFYRASDVLAGQWRAAIQRRSHVAEGTAGRRRGASARQHGVTRRRRRRKRSARHIRALRMRAAWTDGLERPCWRSRGTNAKIEAWAPSCRLIVDENPGRRRRAGRRHGARKRAARTRLRRGRRRRRDARRSSRRRSTTTTSMILDVLLARDQRTRAVRPAAGRRRDRADPDADRARGTGPAGRRARRRRRRLPAEALSLS